ncbi:collagen alpha-1(XV) chain [Caerostris extrusa]|uniref:Collagen alpha-1(XV) chain n=1 Tax=Caerostris extrusa TaxID=172846 RepID=A0AAV4WNR3_CAEEX|nr:collagen alpha-1(XV) chain [Caerostris extrusa]
MKGIVGPSGPPGPPGPPGLYNIPFQRGQQKKPACCCSWGNAVTLKNVDSLLRVSEISPLGTLGFVLDEETLLVRVSGGWQYVAVRPKMMHSDYKSEIIAFSRNLLGSLVPLPSATTTTTSTTPAPLNPPVGGMKADTTPRVSLLINMFPTCSYLSRRPCVVKIRARMLGMPNLAKTPNYYSPRSVSHSFFLFCPECFPDNYVNGMEDGSANSVSSAAVFSKSPFLDSERYHIESSVRTCETLPKYVGGR